METLPSEIITQILEYLPFDDRRELARVNKVFYQASSHPVFLRKELLIYEPYGFDLSNLNDFKNMLFKSRRKLLCLKLVNYPYNDGLTIFTNLGNNIISLNFTDLPLLNDSFLDAITQCCNNLETLEFINVMDLILTNYDRKPIPKLCKITLNGFLIPDRQIKLILKIAPNLKDLSILDCNFFGKYPVEGMYHPPIIDIDGPHTKHKYSNDIFSEHNIIHHLNDFVRLNSLRLKERSNIFCQIEPIQLEIKSLSLNLMETIYIDYPKLYFVLGQYVFLEQLELFGLPINMLSVVSKLYNLKHLTIEYTPKLLRYFDCCENLKSFVESLKNLKYIRTLSFNGDIISNSHYALPTYQFPECTLKSLTSLDCSLDSNLRVLKFSKNLTNLRIRNGGILKVKDLQLLFRDFTNLKHLWINNCSVLNDEIFIKLSISNLKELITLKIKPSNISHRCLRHITNSRLKILTLTDMSLEPCSTQAELNEFKHSVEMLSRAVPKLTRLNICAQSRSLDTIESSDNLTYFKTTFKTLLTTYFEKLKILKLCCTGRNQGDSDSFPAGPSTLSFL